MIQFLHSGLQGAPTNINAAGAMCAIADACLVDGFNAMSPVTVTVSAGVATLVYAAPHGYTADQYLRVLGASAPQVNGDKRPTILDAQSLTVPAAGAPDGPVGGSISTRFAPLGWERVFTDVNVRVYRSPNVEGSRMFYRLQDTATGFLSAGVRGYEAMSEANTGVDAFPTPAQVAGAGHLFYKSSSATPRPWLVCGDSRTVYLATTDFSFQSFYPLCFGDIASDKAGDAFGAVITSVNGLNVDRLAMLSPSGYHLARSFDQLTKSVGAGGRSPIGGDSGINTFPSVVSGGATLVGPIHLAEGLARRGSFRGLLHLWEQQPAWPFSVLSGVAGVAGRVLVITCGQNGRIAFPLDQAW